MADVTEIKSYLLLIHRQKHLAIVVNDFYNCCLAQEKYIQCLDMHVLLKDWTVEEPFLFLFFFFWRDQ